jgi:tRNA(Arg) A34 adenosine deaminase TadA
MTTPFEHHDDRSDILDARIFGLSRRRFLIGTTGLFLSGGVKSSLIEGAWAADPKAAEKPFDREVAETFMRRAIALSRQGMEAGDGGPFGAVVVKEGKIVGEGWNRVLVAKDPTAHGEIVAIRDTCKKLATFNLTGCELFTSAQPCPMCLGAIYWARIDRVYYGNSVQDAAAIGFDDELFYEQLMRPSHKRHIPEVQVLGNEAIHVFQDYANKPGRVTY